MMYRKVMLVETYAKEIFNEISFNVLYVRNYMESYKKRKRIVSGFRNKNAPSGLSFSLIVFNNLNYMIQNIEQFRYADFYKIWCNTQRFVLK